MDDKTLVNTGMAYSEKTMETADDIIQALLAALSGKSTIEQNHVLETFAKYVQDGGGLHAAQFSAEHLKDFELEAKANRLTYYAVTDRQSGKVSVIIQDCDIRLFQHTAEQMAEKGNPLYKDPQLYVAEFFDKYKSKDIVFSKAESLETIRAAKRDAADRNIEFAIGKQPDNSYIVMYLKEDYETLAQLGIADKTRNPVSISQSVNIQEVKRTVEQKRAAMNAERGKQKKKRYER